MTEAFTPKQSVFTAEQLALLSANTIEAIRNGLAGRYAYKLKSSARYFENLAKSNRAQGNEHQAKMFDLEVVAFTMAIGAELPFVFTSISKFIKEDTGTNYSLGIAKVLPETGMLLPASSISQTYVMDTMQIVEHRNDVMLRQDAEFSLLCLRQQFELGMAFHPFEGFAFSHDKS